MISFKDQNLSSTQKSNSKAIFGFAELNSFDNLRSNNEFKELVKRVNRKKAGIRARIREWEEQEGQLKD